MKKACIALLVGLSLLGAAACAADSYRFCEDGFDLFTGERYSVLAEAQVGEITLGLMDGSYYLVNDAFVWTAEPIREESIRPEAMPRTIEEVRAIQALRDYLADEACIDRRTEVDLGLNRKLPVYAAPSAEAYRAANGKASVSLAEPFTLLAYSEDDVWWLVEYEIAEGEKRIGYVERQADVQIASGGLWEIPQEIVLSRDATLTDDPFGSGRALKPMKAGDTVTSLGWVDALWAYVETEIDGRAARGFLPLIALQKPEETLREDVMAQLVGTWAFDGGAELLNMGVVIRGDGTLTTCTTDDYVNVPPTSLTPTGESLSFKVYDAVVGRYAGAAYVIEVVSGENAPSRYGLEWISAEENSDGAECFGLYIGYGGGFYRRFAPENAGTF